MANEENRKLQRAAIGESRAARKREGMDAKNQFTLEKFNKLYSKIDDDFVVKVPDPNKDGSYIEDRSAVPSARALAMDLFKNNVSPEQIMTQLNKTQDIMQSERGLDPKLTGLRALELGQKRISDEVQAQAADKQFVRGIINKGTDSTYQLGSFGSQPQRFGLPQPTEVLPTQPGSTQMTWGSTASGFTPRTGR